MAMLNNQMVDQERLTKIYEPSLNWAGPVVSTQESKSQFCVVQIMYFVCMCFLFSRTWKMEFTLKYPAVNRIMSTLD